MTTIVRAQLAHTPRNPFGDSSALEAFADGAVAFSGRRFVACGSWSEIRAGFAGAEVMDARDAVLMPGFVDCHVHFPQLRVIGAMGLELAREESIAEVRVAGKVVWPPSASSAPIPSAPTPAEG